MQGVYDISRKKNKQTNRNKNNRKQIRENRMLVVICSPVLDVKAKSVFPLNRYSRQLS